MSKLSERVKTSERKIDLLLNHEHDENGNVTTSLSYADYLASDAYDAGVKQGKKLAQVPAQEASEAV